MVDISKHLNRSQLEVVNTLEGPVLVIAGAGSGKTRVIEYRVLNLVQNKIAPQSILLLTFTRRASREMLSRAAGHDVRCNYVAGGTFHSYAYQVLKKHSGLIGFESFSILDEDDAQEAVWVCAKRTTSWDKDKRFPKKDTLRKIISMTVNKGAGVEQVLEREYPNFLDYAKEIEKIASEFSRYKLEKRYFDYDDLLVYLKLLLVKHPGLRHELSSKHHYIMVDEYQDTNPLQAEITYQLGKDHSNVMVVGDDAQSIYGFRGASHENIMAFPAKFPGCRVIKLQDNYRSQQKILDVANAILSTMRNKYDKHLVSANGTEGEKPQLLYFRSADEEGSWIAHKVLEMRDEGVDLHKQAVLFRSSYISIPLQMELNRCNIPYQVYGGMKFYETAHVKDLFSYLKVIHNFRDEISWSRMLSLIEGIGPKTCERLTQELFRHPIAEEALEKVLKADQGHKYSRELARLAGLLEKVGKENSCFRQFELCLEYYKPSFKLKFDDWTQRENDLDALKQMSSNYASLRDFLADFTLEPPERGVAEVFPSAKEDEKPLTLSTIHSAKGLEWETVYLIGLIDGILPVSFALANEDSIEEEQRLFYVAVTRAKRHLYLSVHHESRGFGMNQFNRISRFIENPRVLSCLETGAFTVASSDTDDEYDIDL